jgi:hypothetical protein
VQALAYLPSIKGLPGGDGHGGWLISSSKGMLNLWECNYGGGRDHPSLMVGRVGRMRGPTEARPGQAGGRLFGSAAGAGRRAPAPVAPRLLGPGSPDPACPSPETPPPPNLAMCRAAYAQPSQRPAHLPAAVR